MVVAYAPDNVLPEVRAHLYRKAEVIDNWAEVEQRISSAAGLIVVKRYLDDTTLLRKLHNLPTHHPMLQLAVVCRLGARNIDTLARHGVRLDRFLALKQLDQLLAVVEEFMAATAQAWRAHSHAGAIRKLAGKRLR